MRRVVTVAVLLALGAPVFGQVQLPESLRLAGPLSTGSEFGDEFFNFPGFFQGKAEPGSTFLSGWIEISFSPPEGNTADFTVTFSSVGTEDGIVFPGGQTYTLLNNRAFSNPAFVSRGRLNLTTGSVDSFELHALFQNSVISKVTKNIRIPFGFINDYPPAALPLPLPFDDEPRVFEDVEFHLDGNGRITGFEFHGETIAPVTLFPLLGIFPPYSFGDDDGFYFANPGGCLPGTPAENCFTDDNNPDGIRLDKSAFFHPHLDLVSLELRELPETRPAPPCFPLQITSGNGLVHVEGALYHMGGQEDSLSAGLVREFVGNQWTELTRMPYPVTDARSVSIGDHIYLVGGIDSQQLAASSRLQIFDTASREWSQGSDAPAEVFGAAAVAIGSELYLIGGWSKDLSGVEKPSQLVQIYDSESDTWRLGNETPLAVADAGIVALEGRIYLINGRGVDNHVSNQVWLYDPGSDSWSEGPRTVVAVYAATAGYVDGRIYLAGGRGKVDGPSLGTLQILEMDQGRWRRGLGLAIPIAEASGAVVDEAFYVVGGRTMVGVDEAPGAMSNVLQIYDPGTGWRVCDSHPLFTSRDVMSAACGSVGPVDLSPGGRAVILGHNFVSSGGTVPWIRVTSDGFTADVATELNGIRIWVDGKPAPILSVQPQLVEFQVPLEVQASSRTRRKVPLQVWKEAADSQLPPVMIPLRAAAPSIFTYNFGEFRNVDYLDRATALARNSDGKINHPSQPAQPGEQVSILVTGLGFAFPTLESGQRAGDDPRNEAAFLPQVTIGGLDADVVSVTLVPREVGIYEVKVRVPEDSPKANNVLVELEVAAIQSNRAVISVQ